MIVSAYFFQIEYEVMGVAMENRDYTNLGDNIKNIVQDAVSNGNFSGLSRNIGSTIDSALNEVHNSIFPNHGNSPRPNVPPLNPPPPKQTYSGRVYPGYNPSRVRERPRPRPAYTQYSPPAKANPYCVPVGQVFGTLLTVFGVTGSVITGIAAMIAASLGQFFASGGIFSVAYGFLALFSASVLLWWNGSMVRKRVKRFRKYVEQLRGRNYCLLKDFSAATGFTSKYIARDLKKMIQIGMFPDGHIDDKKTCFMLNRESYQLYLELQNNIRAQEAPPAPETVQTQAAPADDGMTPEVRSAIDEGRQYVAKIRIANVAIPGEEVSKKLDRLEAVTGKIFDYVELHPDQYSEIKKFMGYYLPTTLKLLDAYKEFDYQPVQGENIATAKKEIEKTLDTINHAFENLLDSLFKDAAMDISTDISVLETMFAQEGLTNKGMKASENKSTEGE